MRAMLASMFAISLFFICGCQGVIEVTDNDLRSKMAKPREQEQFYYVGSKNEFDYFVGEQWSLHSYPPSAKETERYYKIRNSKIPKERFPLTKDVKEWDRMQ